MSNRVALVTGAGRGIGRAIAIALANTGASVAVNDVVAANAEETVNLLTGNGIPVLGDVSQADSVQKMIDAVLQRFGRVDILVNNAGICRRGRIDEISEDDWDRTISINLKGTFLSSRAVIPSMKASKWGRIINVASISGKIGGLMVALDYTASKGGILAFTKGLAREVASLGITVNAVCPALADTDMGQMFSLEEKSKYLQGVPLGRLATAEDIAQAVVYLASDAASYITGEVLDINGGLLMD
jgi:3-oxoacyl-[acyl-carrier protein] reductase